MRQFSPKSVICSIVISILAFSFCANAQVTFTHTSNSDFLNGTVQNANITNNSVVPLQRMSGLASWESTTNLPQVLSGHKMAGWRNYVYCVGGYTGSAFVSTVYRATFQTAGISGWTTLTALPVSLRDAAVVCTQTQLVVIGGRNANGIRSSIYTAQLNSDGSIQAWKTSSVELPQAMFGIQATMVNDDIYLFGGSTSEQASGYSDKAYLLKVNALGVPTALTECTAMPQARCFHAVASNGNNIFVTGGMNANGDKQSTVWRATVNNDGTLGSWQTMSSLPSVLAQHTAICTNDVIAVVGGVDNSGFASNKTTYSYTDGSGLSWQESDEFLSNRTMDAAICGYGNSVLVSGGVNMVGSTLANTVYMPILTSSAQVKEASFISAPFFIGDPKNVQQLSFTLSNNTTDYQLLYRVAGMDKNYGSWILADQGNPTTLNVTTNYLQYKFIFNATTGVQPSLDDLTLTLSGITQLSGNLDSYDTLRAALSPYWATGSISFTTGTHAIEPGVVIMFSPNTGLDITRANVYFNGTADDNITLTSYDHEVPNWNGVYFQDASDNGVTSRLSYTNILFAGNGDNNANLRLYNTNQPTIDHCLFNGADGYGVRLVNSHPTISNSQATNNTESGFHFEGSSPTLNGITSSDNGFAGMYYANASVSPSLTDISLSGNLYGIYSYTPDVSFAQSAQILMSANATDVALNGGTIASNRVWGFFPNGYALLGDVTIQGGSCPKLTIAPGNSIKVAEGKYIYIGGNSTTGGKLSAVGKADSLITFTALNGNIGGWGGLWFRDGSDYNSSSTLRYCVIEKGNDRNIFCENTAQPYILNCVLREAANQNLRTNSSPITVESTHFSDAPYGWYMDASNPILISDIFDNHSECCVYLYNNAAPNIYTTGMNNSHKGIWISTPNRDISNFNGVIFSNNTYNIAVNGSDISSDVTWCANTYSILGNIRVVCYHCTSRLTIKPGATLKFANNTGLQMGANISGNGYGGALTAIGTADSLITFTALNDSVGGWNGIYFDPRSDDYGSDSSVVRYCILEKGKEYNLFSDATRMPYIDHSTFRQSNGYGLWLQSGHDRPVTNCTFIDNATDGIWIVNSTNKIENCSFENNGRYPIHYNNALYVDTLLNLSFNNNTQEMICIDGGDINGRDRTFFNPGIPYAILGNIRVVCYHCTSRLTIKPGATLKFANNTGLQMGANISGSGYSGGALTAIGTADSLITFTALNDSVGGWNGIYFDLYSDDYGSQISDLHYCKIEKGKDYNLRSSGTLMPSIEHCVIAMAATDGLQFENEYNHIIKNCEIRDNGRYGILLQGNAIPVIGGTPLDYNAIFNNGRYGIYQDGSQNIDARYNFWAVVDSLTIAKQGVYDKSDNSGKGTVTYMPYSWIPPVIEPNRNLEGELLYGSSTNSTPVSLSAVNIIDFNNSVLLQETNTIGTFHFENIDTHSAGKIDFIHNYSAGNNAINATDALLAMQHFAHITTLNSTQFKAADINNNLVVNGTDAMLILKRYVNGTPFAAGEYVVYADTITSTGNTYNYDFNMLWYGDIDGSYTFSRGLGNEVTLQYDDQHPILSRDTVVNIPVIAKGNYNVGAISLSFNYPEEQMDIRKVVLKSTGDTLSFHAEDGELRIGWYSLNPLALNFDDTLLTIVAHLDIDNLTEPIQIGINPYSELADENATVIPDVVLSTPLLFENILGITDYTGAQDGSEEALWAGTGFYPNPGNGAFVLADPNNIVRHIAVYDVSGRLLQEMTAEEANGHIDLSAFASGIYFLKLDSEQTSKTCKVVIEK